METTINLNHDPKFDPRILGEGELFCFQYDKNPLIVLMKTYKGACVLARQPEDGCGCTDKPGHVWGIDSLNPDTCGRFSPFTG